MPLIKKNKIRKKRLGLTLIETILAVAVSVIVIMGLPVVMADNQNGWNKIYNKVNSNIVDESIIARIVFESNIRKSSKHTCACSIGTDGSWVETNYYSDISSGILDRYAKFYVSGNDLLMEKGVISPRETLSLETLSSNVANCNFEYIGSAVQMLLELDDGTYQIKINCAAVMHNP